jgi:phytoene desaturase
MPEKKVVIVGAGIGGLALAARLTKSGYSVEVFEKNKRAGGRVAQKKVKGYTIDLGPTFLLMPRELEELFEYCGERFSSHVPIQSLSPLYRLHYSDKTFLDVHSTLPEMRQSFLRFDPENGNRHFQGFLDFLAYENEKFSIVYDRFITKPAHSLWKLVFSTDFPKLFQLDGFISMWELAGEFFSTDKLKLAFSFQSMYVGESPLETPGTYGIIPFVELTQGVWYPKEGIQSLVEAIEKLAKKNGAKFHYGKKVEEIVIENGAATGIRIGKGKIISADIVVSNLDLPATYHRLIPPEKRRKYSNQKLNALRYGCSAFMMYVGVKKDYAQLTHHNVFFTKNYLQNFNEIFKTMELSQKPSLYVNVPSKTNPKLAPKGKHLLYVLVPVPSNAQKDGKKVDWKEYKDEYSRTILDTLEQNGLTDLKKNIEMMELFTPDDWESLAGMHLGSTFGLSPIFLQSSVFRPHQQSEEFKNLYFVGASTHPGSGMPLVLIGARTCEKLIQDDRQGK